MSRAEVIACGYGLAGLALAPQASPMLVALDRVLLHQKYSLVTVPLGLLLYYTIFGALCSLLVFGISRIREGWVRRLGFALLICVGLRLARYVFLMWMKTPRAWSVSRNVLHLLSIVIVVLAVVSAHWFYTTLKKFQFLIPGIGIFALLMWFQLVRFAVATDRVSRQPGPTLAAAFPQSPLKHRVVWIVFDELSYREMFDRASANGLSLPTFDSVRAHSVSFRNVVPAAYMTEFAVPGLFLGTTVEDVGAGNPRQLTVHYAGNDGFTAFDPQATIFGELHRQHLNSAVVGWYYPYCDLLATVVSTCQWETDNMKNLVPGMYAEQSVWKNATSFLRRTIQNLAGRKSDPPIRWEPVERQRSYKRIMSAAVSDIATPGNSLIFVHIPVPHPLGFFDRRTGTMSNGGSYLDNLVLADRTLQALLDAVQASKESNVTTVIVTSDHSWRVEMWRRYPHWLPEEAAAAPATFDARIPMLVDFPDQHEGLEIDKPFEALRSRSMISGILQGEWESGEALRAWADGDRTAQRQTAEPRH